ncbi:MAG: hypothetical protein HFF18_00580 [Oscillospiraceae bacterium]|nr:hypothetical protein [Oscillospiraceae bacterium]
MQLKTSLFNPVLFRKNLTRFWPIWTIYGLLWFLMIPAELLSRFQSYYQDQGLTTEETRRHISAFILRSAAQNGIILAFGFGCIAALAVFSYLYQHRSAVAMHSFPLRRECLFFTSYLSGLAFLIFPLAVVFLSAAAVELAFGALNVSTLLVWFTAQVGYVLFFYSFAVFCAMFTGNLFALPIFYGILSVLVPGLHLLLDNAFSQFIYGYESSASRMQGLSVLCSPPLALLTNVDVVERELEDGAVLVYMSGWNLIILYAVVGLILAGAALAVYRRRQVETAGDVVSVALVRPVFKYGVAVCAALLGSTMLFDAFFDSNSPYSAGIMLVLMLLCGGVGYFVAQMLLEKSFRVFGRHWPGFAVLSAVLAALVCAAYFDPLQVVAPIPAARQVESVSILNVNTYPDSARNRIDIEDPALIAGILDLHHTVVAQRTETQEKLRTAGRSSSYLTETSGLPHVEDEESYYFRLQYKLANGGVLTRGYTILVSQAELANPDSPAARLEKILNDCDRSGDFMEGYTVEQVFQAEVNLKNETTGEWEDVTLDQAEARILCQAALDDWKEGILGRVWLICSQDYQESTYAHNIGFSVSWRDERGESHTTSLWVTPLTTSERTIAALEELGVLNKDRPLLTVWERRLAGQE